MSGTGPFTLDAAINKGLGTTPGSVGVAMNASKPQDGGSSPPESWLWVLEDGSGYWELEDGSGNWELESGP